MSKPLNNQVVLITGGTGSFGKSFIKFILRTQSPKKVIVFSRDEFKQHEMQQEVQDDRLRFFVGDIKDPARLQRAFTGVDIIIHAAALKQVPSIEYNPFEAIKTNIIGSQNVIDAAIDNKVKKALLISSDKAVQPISLYGATKMAAEKLFTAANAYIPAGETVFGSVRYGNVLGSRGSIVETILKNKDKLQSIKITDPKITRFWLSLEESWKLVLFALENIEGGEIFVPKIASMKLSHLFDALAPKIKQEIIGPRPGDKTHEVLLTEHESKNTVFIAPYYIIMPEIYFREGLYKKYYKLGKKLNKKFEFASHTNNVWLTKKELKEKINNKVI